MAGIGRGCLINKGRIFPRFRKPLADALSNGDSEYNYQIRIGTVAEEKNAKNSAGAGDENTKNYVSRCIGVFLGEESEFPIRFVISLMVSEILTNYCSKGRKDVLFSQGV